MTIHPRLILIYLITSVLCLTFLLLDFDFGFFVTKPLILPVLLFFLLLKFKSTKHQLIPPLMIATFFSFLGDIFLMVQVEESLFKLLGICTFIVAQTAYALLYYYSTYDFKKRKINIIQRWPEFLTIIITMTTLIFVFPTLGVFAVPAIIYTVIGSIAIVFALNRRFYVSQKSFIITIIGVIFFYLGDAIMGHDLFLSNKHLHVIVLLFYILAHFLIIKGIMIQIDKEIKRTPRKDAQLF
ncbi:lysoplasmalogenase [Belliella sp. DSM 107340]|uniref:Lysoplasmalogenase n=1 Tax=Belliella calami TaxID=2923436 RepID=A0ABS9UKD1_9BACT|nr:lysoplasmalogenase family protein [Belliella calami]MCH7397079.1 lysoplasmalogenase [Belliella calami]